LGVLNLVAEAIPSDLVEDAWPLVSSIPLQTPEGFKLYVTVSKWNVARARLHCMRWFFLGSLMPPMVTWRQQFFQNPNMFVSLPRIDNNDYPIKDRTKRRVLHPVRWKKSITLFSTYKMQISRLLLALLPFSAIALAIPINPAEAGRSTLRNFTFKFLWCLLCMS
jgi:hypothetical protein